MLIVEPDRLTMWSVATYLRRWFVVDAVSSADAARLALRRHRFAALVISDALPEERWENVQRLAQRDNADLRTVLLVTVPGEPGEPGGPQAVARIEKPFELPALARLLGVPRQEPATP